MKQINPLKEAIKLYAKQLRMPTFSNYENVVRQLAPGDGYDSIPMSTYETRTHFSVRKQVKDAGSKRPIFLLQSP